MKSKEFYEILEKFVYEQERWKKLKVGDIVYDEEPRFIENDYHKAIIKEINVNERFIIVNDLSVTPIEEKKYHNFVTQEEFNKLIS